MSSKLDLIPGELVMLVAPRGTGKTTFSYRIQNMYGNEKVTILNFDKVFEENSNDFIASIIIENKVKEALKSKKIVIIDNIGNIHLECRNQLIDWFKKYSKRVTIVVILRNPDWCLEKVLQRPDTHPSKKGTILGPMEAIIYEHILIMKQISDKTIEIGADRVITATGKQIDDLL